MSDLVKLSCPSCGGLIVHVKDDEYRCESCQNRYLLSQKGNKIS